MEGVIEVHYTSLTSQGVQHKEIIQMVTHPDIKPIQQGLISVNGREPGGVLAEQAKCNVRTFYTKPIKQSSPYVYAQPYHYEIAASQMSGDQGQLHGPGYRPLS